MSCCFFNVVMSTSLDSLPSLLMPFLLIINFFASSDLPGSVAWCRKCPSVGPSARARYVFIPFCSNLFHSVKFQSHMILAGNLCFGQLMTINEMQEKI